MCSNMYRKIRQIQHTHTQLSAPDLRNTGNTLQWFYFMKILNAMSVCLSACQSNEQKWKWKKAKHNKECHAEKQMKEWKK